MIVDHVPVRDFAGSADPRRDMHRSYVEARKRMERPRQTVVAAVPVSPEAPTPSFSMVPPPDYVMTKEAYARALQIRRDHEKAHRPLLRVVSAVTGIPITAILSPSRLAPVIKARQIAYYLIRSGTALSYPQIGRRLNRDHSSILFGCARIEGVILDLQIAKSSDPVEMCDRLWSVRWSAAAK